MFSSTGHTHSLIVLPQNGLGHSLAPFELKAAVPSPKRHLLPLLEDQSRAAEKVKQQVPYLHDTKRCVTNLHSE